MKYETMITAILKYVGGQENIRSVSHCMTRLRIVVKEDSKVQLEELKKIDGVINCIIGSGQYQIVIGNAVKDVYDEFLSFAGLENTDPVAASVKEKAKGIKGLLNSLIETMAALFVPMISVFAGSGVLRALLLMLAQFGVMSKESQTYILINMMTDSVFYFMPILLAYNAGKRFKCDPFVSMALAGILLHPTFVGLVAAGEPIMLFGLPVTGATYSTTFLPIIMIVYLQSWIEKEIRKVCPKVLEVVFVPLLVLAITGTVGLVVLGPIGDILGKGIANSLNTLDAMCSWLVPMLMGALFPVLVITGTHHGLFSAQLVQFMSVGYCTVYIPGALCANMASMGACLGVAMRTRDKGERSIALSAAVSAICGITEPALYGISLKYKTPLVATIIGGGVAGLFAGLTRVRGFALGGTNIFSLPIFLGEGNNFLFACLMILIAIIVTAMITFVTYREPQKA